MRLFRQFILRRLTTERMRTAVAVGGIALGVAVVLAIRLANQSSVSGFASALDAMSGAASLEIVGPAGGIDEQRLAQLDWLWAQLAPRHRDAAAIAGVKPPTFLAQGVWDFNVPPTRWAGVLPTFRDCTYRAFERSGHYPFYEEPDLFDATLLEWLAAPRPTEP